MIYLRKAQKETPQSRDEDKPDNSAVRLIAFLLGVVSGLCIAAMAFHSRGM